MDSYPNITDILTRGRKSETFPGIFLLFARKGDIRYKKAVGSASLIPYESELTEDTIFDIASLTKVMATTSALMMLVKEKSIGLKEKASCFIPSLEDHGKGEITIRHLLCHSSGLPAWRPFYQKINKGKDFIPDLKTKDMVYKLVHQEPLIYPVGEDSKYSDLGFILLQEIIETVANMSLDRFCHETIFKPLGMEKTFFVPLPDKSRKKEEFAATEDCPWRKRVLRGEVHDDNAYAMGGVAGHAGLFATGEDIYVFAKEVLDTLKGKGRLFLKEILEEFVKREGSVEGSTMALGWDTPSRVFSTSGKYFSEGSIGHTGFTGVSLWIDIKREIIIILLSNRVHPSRENEAFNRFRPYIHDTVMEELLKEDHG